MDCPKCGKANGSERVECDGCGTLLLDVFSGDARGAVDVDIEVAEAESAPTQPRALPSNEEQEILKAFRQSASTAVRASDDEHPEFQYTGDLPRLFRFGERYQILEKLGEGGMGRVYKAMDLELDRPVALKTIRSEKGSSPELLQRFKQELVLARKVTHKNVIRIYDLGESEGMKFFTMELVEGRSVRDLLRDRGKLSVNEALSLFKQLLSGLAEAHSQSVVHRDLKPQNLMLDGEGTLRIMDFGIARTADSVTITGTSEMMGTPDYISPEQVKGEEADAKSDLYSAGVILYELLTGSVPFAGDTALSKVVARIQSKPKSARSLNPEIPSYVDRIVSKLMEVDPELRYQSAEQVLEDLEREQVDRSPWLRFKKLARRHRGRAAAAAVAGVTVVAAWIFLSPPDPEALADIDATTLAVLPFHNLAGIEELDWMQQGVPEMLITDVSQLRTLRPVLADRIASILVDLGKDGETRFDEETLRVVSEMSVADYTLHGSFVESEDRLRLDLSLRESATGVAIPIQIDGKATEVFTLVDSITNSISRELDLDAGREDRPLSEVSTASVEAYRAYQEGLSELKKGATQSAIPKFERAVEQDPSFAMAHAKLAEALFQLEDPRAETVAEQAVALLDEASLPVAERYQIHAIAALVTQDRQTAVDSYQRLSELYPDDPEVLMGLASSLENVGEIDSALTVYQQIVDRDEDHGAALLGLGRNLWLGERSAEAIPILEQAIISGKFDEALDSLGYLHSILGVAYRSEKEFARALTHLEKSLEYRREASDIRGVVVTLTNMSTVFRETGRNLEARRALLEGLQLARKDGMLSTESFVLQNLGNLALESGRLEEAREAYEQSLHIEWDLGQKNEIVYRLDALAEVYRLRGELAQALVFLTAAEGLLGSTSDPTEEAFNRSVRGQSQMARGHYSDALEDLLSAIPALEGTDQSRDMVAARNALAELYIAQGRLSEALDTIERTLSLAGDNSGLRKRTEIVLADLYLTLGDPAKASDLLEAAGESIAEVPLFEAVPQYHLTLGRLRLAQGNTLQAEREFSKALQEAERRENFAPTVEAQVAIAQTRVVLGRADAGLALATSALSHARRAGHRLLEVKSLLVRAQAHLKRATLEAAKADSDLALDLATRSGDKMLRGSALSLRSQIAQRSGDAQLSIAAREEWDRLQDEILSNLPAKYRDAFRHSRDWLAMKSPPEARK